MKRPNLPDLSLRDAHVYGGLALATVAGANISPEWALIGLGVVLVLLGLYGPGARSD